MAAVVVVVEGVVVDDVVVAAGDLVVADEAVGTAAVAGHEQAGVMVSRKHTANGR